jgi:hypothetical protein
VNREVTVSKEGVIQAMGIQDWSWMEEEMALFNPRVCVSNAWGRSKRAKHGNVIYQTPYKYRIRFPNHTRYVLKHDVDLVDRSSPPRVLSFVSASVASPAKEASVVPSEVI